MYAERYRCEGNSWRDVCRVVSAFPYISPSSRTIRKSCPASIAFSPSVHSLLLKKYRLRISLHEKRVARMPVFRITETAGTGDHFGHIPSQTVELLGLAHLPHGSPCENGFATLRVRTLNEIHVPIAKQIAVNWYFVLMSLYQRKQVSHAKRIKTPFHRKAHHTFHCGVILHFVSDRRIQSDEVYHVNIPISGGRNAIVLPSPIQKKPALSAFAEYCSVQIHSVRLAGPATVVHEAINQSGPHRPDATFARIFRTRRVEPWFFIKSFEKTVISLRREWCCW